MPCLALFSDCSTVGWASHICGCVAFALLACMAASSGLLWRNYRGVDFSGAEETIYGALFGGSVFGLMLSAILALMA